MRPRVAKTWGVEQVAWLAAHVKGRSYQELAEEFNAHFGENISSGQIKWACQHRKLYNGLPSSPTRNGPKYWGCFSVGSERWRSPGGRGVKRLFVKIAEPNIWKPKHVLLWEEAYGPVPPGCVVIFIDRDYENFSLENLALLTRSEFGVLNNYRMFFHDAELTKAGVGFARLKVAVNEAKRQQ
jgi:hypothetical protein